MFQQVCEVAEFIRRLRTQLRFGALSRAPLELLRLEVVADTADCEWMARPADPWDLDLPVSVRDRNVTDQALKDVLAVRQLLFSVLPQVLTVNIRVYRRFPAEPPELIIAGTVSRNEPSYGAQSLVMQAKLCGLQFQLSDGRLEPFCLRRAI